MSETKIKVGIFGCGGIAMGKHLPSLSRLLQVELAKFCDIDENKAHIAKEKYGNAASIITLDYRTVLEDASIDVIHVCTPNSSHAEIAG